jgi:hypothetical protein
MATKTIFWMQIEYQTPTEMLTETATEI